MSSKLYTPPEWMQDELKKVIEVRYPNLNIMSTRIDYTQEKGGYIGAFVRLGTESDTLTACFEFENKSKSWRCSSDWNN